MRVLCRPSARRPTRPRLHLLSPQLAYLLPTGNPSRRKCHRGAPNAFPIFATLSLPNPAYWNKSVFLYLQMTTGVSRFRYIFFLVYSIPYISVRLGRERQKKKTGHHFCQLAPFLGKVPRAGGAVSLGTRRCSCRSRHFRAPRSSSAVTNNGGSNKSAGVYLGTDRGGCGSPRLIAVVATLTRRVQGFLQPLLSSVLNDKPSFPCLSLIAADESSAWSLFLRSYKTTTVLVCIPK